MTARPLRMAKNRAHDLLERWEHALEAGEIDEDRWYQEIAAVITPAYLAGEDPRAQSGKSGTEEEWEYARSLVADAINRDGTFLDVGCASGYLMECIPRWSRDRGYAVEPYGLDIAPELASLARRRMPQWADRIFVGNAIHWQPPMRSGFVRTGLDYVPGRRQPDLVRHLLNEVVAPGGRLIVGVSNEERTEPRHDPPLDQKLETWGFVVAGKSGRPHPRDPRLMYQVVWIDAQTGSVKS